MTMNTDELLAAADVLVQASTRFADLPLADDDAAAGALHCMLAGLVLTKLARHLLAGAEPVTAQRLAVLGTGGATAPQRAAIVAMLAQLMRDAQH